MVVPTIQIPIPSPGGVLPSGYVQGTQPAVLNGTAANGDQIVSINQGGVWLTSDGQIAPGNGHIAEIGHNGVFTVVAGYPDSTGEPFGMNSAHEIIGQGQFGGTFNSYTLVDGVATKFIEPDAVDVPSITIGGGPPVILNSTYVRAIDDAGDIGGSYKGADGQYHGFVHSASTGVFTTVDMPGKTDTVVTAIHADGSISGYSGANVGPSQMLPGVADPLHPAATFTGTPANFVLTDVTRGVSSGQMGDAYHGPVAGLTSEFVQIGLNNLNITLITPNAFIHTGAGMDGIDVSKAGGNNIMDGGTSSNFLTGGAGQDIFYTDDRGTPANQWSTIAGFHGGDAATIWGITEGDAKSYLDDMGATGFTGLTINVIKPGSTTSASVTLASYRQTDLASGALSVSYGHTGDLPGLPGSDYMTITHT